MIRIVRWSVEKRPEPVCPQRLRCDSDRHATQSVVQRSEVTQPMPRLAVHSYPTYLRCHNWQCPVSDCSWRAARQATLASHRLHRQPGRPAIQKSRHRQGINRRPPAGRGVSSEQGDARFQGKRVATGLQYPAKRFGVASTVLAQEILSCTQRAGGPIIFDVAAVDLHLTQSPGSFDPGYTYRQVKRLVTTDGRYGLDFCASLNSVACLSIVNTLSEGPAIPSTIACSSSPPIGLT